MDKTLGQELDLARRIQMLRDNCEKTEELGYMKPFTPDEISTMKDQLSEVAISINDIENEKKEANKAFKLELDPLCDTKKALLKNIKEKAEFVKEDCFKIIDFDLREVGYYNNLGILVQERKMRPDEGQRTINLKTGTND